MEYVREMNSNGSFPPVRRSMQPRRFADFVGKESSVTPILPVLHTTTAFYLAEMVNTGYMIPGPCRVFTGENLLYFYYGKPTYRDELSESAIVAEAPVCIILSSDIISKSKRIFPFDSGAFDRYRRFLPRAAGLAHFELSSSRDEPSRIISAFFETNDRYLDGIARQDRVIAADQFEAAALYELYRYKGSGEFDDRGWTIELQVPEDVELRTPSVLALIMPNALAETELHRAIVDQWRIEPILYPLSGRWRPKEFHSQIEALARKSLRDLRYI